MNLGNKIQKIRKDNKISQEEFAEVLNVTRQTVSNWENQKNYPDIETLILISNKYNISLDVLLKGDKKMIQEINKKIKNHKKLIIIIIVLIVAFLLFIIIDHIFSRAQYYENINRDVGAFIFTKCNYEGERIQLIVEYPALDNGKKWNEPPTYDPSVTKPAEYKVIANWAEPNTEKKVYKDIMDQMNFNAEDYENAFALLDDMKEYMINIGADCD